MSVHYALEDFNKFSTDSYDHQVHQNQFKIPPYLVHNNDGESIRQEFCNMSEEGKIVWDTFIEIKENAKKTAEQDISSILESEFGYSAFHIGNFPEDWAKPGGLNIDNY